MARILVGIAYLAGSGVWLLFSLLVNALRCDDACFRPENAAGWWHLVDAWQWRAILVCGLAATVAAVLIVILTALQRAVPAATGTVVQLAAMGYAVSLLRTAHGYWAAHWTVAAIAALIGAAGLALALLARRAPTTIAA